MSCWGAWSGLGAPCACDTRANDKSRGATTDDNGTSGRVFLCYVAVCGAVILTSCLTVQKTVRDLEDEIQRLRREHRDATSVLQDDFDRLYKEGVSVKQQLRAAQEREEELQNQVRVVASLPVLSRRLAWLCTCTCLFCALVRGSALATAGSCRFFASWYFVLLCEQIVSERKERMSLERAMKSISERMKQTRENQSATEQKAEAVTKVRVSVVQWCCAPAH